MTGQEIDITIRKRLRIRGEICSPPWNGRNHISRVQLAGWFNDFGYKIGAEVGVRSGHYSEAICKAIPGVKMYCVDPYTYTQTGNFNQQQQDRFHRHAIARLAPYDVTFIIKPSLQASFEVPDNSLDFVYIDANHSFDYVMMDLILWNPKVRSGGIVAGHDYFYGDHCGVVQAVNAYTNAHNIKNWYKCNIEDGQKSPSFFWVKP